MKKGTLIAAAFAGVITAGTAAWSAYTHPSHSERRECIQELRDSLRDPESLKVLKVIGSRRGFMEITYRAKNGFGGYAPKNEYSCMNF